VCRGRGKKKRRAERLEPGKEMGMGVLACGRAVDGRETNRDRDER
jgi:hypothetical protein